MESIDSTDDEPDLDRFYGNLHNYVRMVTHGYSNLLLLDAKGGLGKTYNVRKVLKEELPEEMWEHQRGFTTPIELFKTLWTARGKGMVLFLDDMSGVTNNQKALDMLKAATDTEGEENWIEYRTSRDIEHPFIDGVTLPKTFNFAGSIIMSFNETPDNEHFNALRDRGTDYNLSFSYQERLDLIDEVAKLPHFSDLTIELQKETATWIRHVTDASFDVTIRTFENICSMRCFSDETGANWEKMALELFDLDYEKHLIIKLRKSSGLPVAEQIETFKEKTGYGETKYYDLLSEVKTEWM